MRRMVLHWIGYGSLFVATKASALGSGPASWRKTGPVPGLQGLLLQMLRKLPGQETSKCWKFQGIQQSYSVL